MTWYDPCEITPLRMASYAEQFQVVCEKKPDGILDVGVGDGVLTNLLCRHGYSVVSVDIDSGLKPDCAGDVSMLPFKDGCFDFVVAANVLEHLPLDLLPACLWELGRVSRGWVLVVLPVVSPYFHFMLHLPLMCRLLGRDYVDVGFGFGVQCGFTGDVNHFWEVGSMGVSEMGVFNVLNSFFVVDRVFRPQFNRTHLMLLLRCET